MPFALVFVGLILIVTGVKDTQAALGQQVVGDFTGSGNFVFWIASLGAVGALGYVPELKKFSVAFMTLIIIAMLLAQEKNGKGGFFAQFYAALKSGPVAPAKGAGASSGDGTNAIISQNSQQLSTTANSLNSSLQAISANSSANVQSHVNTVVNIAKIFGL